MKLTPLHLATTAPAEPTPAVGSLGLQAREIGASLPGPATPAGAGGVPASEHYPWLDSSLDLELGLDVRELTVDLLLPDLPDPKPAASARVRP